MRSSALNFQQHSSDITSLTVTGSIVHSIITSIIMSMIKRFPTLKDPSVCWQDFPQPLLTLLQTEMLGRSSQSSAEEEGIMRTKLLSFQLYRKPWSTSISSSSKWCASQLWFQPKSTTAAEKKGEGGIGRKRTL